MKISGIRNRFSRTLRYGKTWTHVVHFHGHGIHSPFAYSLIRNVFMKRHADISDLKLFTILRTKGISVKRATQLQNLNSYCRFDRYAVDPAEEDPILPDTLYILTCDTPASLAATLHAQLRMTRGMMCIMAPRQSRERWKTATELVRSHTGMSIDNRGFMLYIYDKRYCKQHLKL